ncbi:hypothetical protein ACIPY6_03095 [Streptomyces sp. NPDC090054]|uniref:hypothetical protein n=1 Tax=Streptomyces sp. NPDC090054 TaxID=3365933 RepID=UPI003826F890
MDIPTEPQPDDTDTIMAALAHGIKGNPQTGLAMLVPLISRGPALAVGVCAALAECNNLNLPEAPPGASYGLLVFGPDGSPSDTGHMPIGPRFAAQFTSAWANGQRDTAYALFDALADSDETEDLDGLFVGIRVLYDMAVTRLADGHDAAPAEES